MLLPTLPSDTATAVGAVRWAVSAAQGGVARGLAVAALVFAGSYHLATVAHVVVHFMRGAPTVSPRAVVAPVWSRVVVAALYPVGWVIVSRELPGALASVDPGIAVAAFLRAVVLSAVLVAPVTALQLGMFAALALCGEPPAPRAA